MTGESGCGKSTLAKLILGYFEGSIAYINLKGGGSTEQHTHEHNHLFIVIKGETKVLLDKEEVIIPKTIKKSSI